MKDSRKYQFEVYYKTSSSSPYYNSKKLFAHDELDAVDLMYSILPDAIIFDVHPIGKSSEVLGYDPAFTSLQESVQQNP